MIGWAQGAAGYGQYWLPCLLRLKRAILSRSRSIFLAKFLSARFHAIFRATTSAVSTAINNAPDGVKALFTAFAQLYNSQASPHEQQKSTIEILIRCRSLVD